MIELERVLDAAPDDIDGHRLGLKAARENRLDLISRCTDRLTARMDAADSRANSKVLFHPGRSRDVVESSNQVALAVGDFHGSLGIEHGRQSVRARRWADTATEARSRALETGADGVDAAKRLGNDTVDRARSARGQLSRRIAERPFRRHADDKERDAEQ